jgi:uncharacterized protein (UPF0254 family)
MKVSGPFGGAQGYYQRNDKVNPAKDVDDRTSQIKTAGFVMETASTRDGTAPPPSPAASGLASLLDLKYPGPALSQHSSKEHGRQQASISASGSANSRLLTPAEMVQVWIDEIGENGVISVQDAIKALGGSNSADDVLTAFSRLDRDRNGLTVAELTAALENYIRNQR